MNDERRWNVDEEDVKLFGYTYRKCDTQLSFRKVDGNRRAKMFVSLTHDMIMFMCIKK